MPSFQTYPQSSSPKTPTASSRKTDGVEHFLNRINVAFWRARHHWIAYLIKPSCYCYIFLFYVRSYRICLLHFNKIKKMLFQMSILISRSYWRSKFTDATYQFKKQLDVHYCRFLFFDSDNQTFGMWIHVFVRKCCRQICRQFRKKTGRNSQKEILKFNQKTNSGFRTILISTALIFQ